jgi:hypothetical protein
LAVSTIRLTWLLRFFMRYARPLWCGQHALQATGLVHLHALHDQAGLVGLLPFVLGLPVRDGARNSFSRSAAAWRVLKRRMPNAFSTSTPRMLIGHLAHAARAGGHIAELCDGHGLHGLLTRIRC